ncbi:peptide chain release factor N(5)-glutamine methyltransferase [Rhodalgimonas zhirmunskyi]|uniref:Release factor glutamine methyltransferase n=1 Tax=Rhodalgimonas zhirmunskyi TaxID=2964767 RepID=A0AAJ1U7R6_9RHOB|nr:peptide chain release factor N(5)-glutamine methyltransferase [Rhodoalgimonas zhirmunskyi]MDQ2093225.1 peptide chain release factor N(5)-glutamine methyltransferase [Rhodoalgimonas zhirmunskyi]
MTAPDRTVDEVLRYGARVLADARCATGDARPLLADILEVDRGRLILLGRDEVSEENFKRFEEYLARRCAREPVAKIIGRRVFWGRYFEVSPEVLDPRPETEILIATALEEPAARLLDLGTGSGIIALTLLAEWSQARGVASDVSEAALAVAQTNAEKSGVEDRLDLVASDWWSGICGTFDLIVSNPPYIALGEMEALDPEVRDHDPHIALTDGADGLTAYREIAKGADAHLSSGGRLIVEIGPTQGDAVSKMFAEAGLKDIAIMQDFDERDRIVFGRKG